MTPAAERHEFKAEVDAVLRLVTNSLYTHREIFLRELLSNASDALDKARFQCLVQSDLRDTDVAPEILVVADNTTGRLVIEDNGLGMTREEAARNLGTIAHSGTLEYLQRMQAEGRKPESGLIGRFGVGFYSAFMVADEVVVDSLSALPGHEAVCWRSKGDGTFELAPGNRTRRGTRIELLLRQDAREFLERFRLQAIVRRYSNYVVHPILLEVVEADGKTGAREQVNAASAFWTRNPADLSDADYQEFYAHAMGGFVMPGDEPLARLHFSMDAPIQFHAILFVPRHAPADLFLDDRKSLQLYAKRVLVMDDCDKLLPPYLRFFRGVVDSEDLPLNVSREMLQEHTSLSAIRRQLTRKALKLLADEARARPERYEKIWGEFGAVIKEGLHSDSGHREELLGLARWRTIAHGAELVSLEQYVREMPAAQAHLYFAAGPDERALRGSPHVEAIRARGWDVLVMTDPVDEWVLQTLREYAGKPFRNVAQGELEPPADPEAPPEPSAIDPLLTRAREVLGERVRDVRASRRLTQSASCLVDPEGGLSRNMERILRSTHHHVGKGTRILELNPAHPFVQTADRVARARPDDPRVPEWIELLHDLAGLAEGHVPDPAGTVRRIQAVLDAVATRE